jgi:uncharacterized protein YndB with AHSA1/START domain
MTGDVHIDRQVSASPRDLWAACATARGLENWCADRVVGTIATGATVRLEWPDLRATVILEVAEFVPGRRVSFRNGATRVALEIGESSVQLTHAGLGAGDDREGWTGSWRLALELLAHGLESHPGKQRRARWFSAHARTTSALAHVYYTDSQGLAAWLGEGPGLGDEGAEYAMRSLSGAPMTGRVLVRSGGRDVALSWREEGNSVLVLRSFPSPVSRSERVLAACWSRWLEAGQEGADESSTTAQTERALKEGVERLARVLGQSGIA